MDAHFIVCHIRTINFSIHGVYPIYQHTTVKFTMSDHENDKFSAFEYTFYNNK